MKIADNFGIIQENGFFIVTKNGQPISLPRNNGQSIVTSFDTRENAQKYIDILKSLKKRDGR